MTTVDPSGIITVVIMYFVHIILRVSTNLKDHSHLEILYHNKTLLLQNNDIYTKLVCSVYIKVDLWPDYILLCTYYSKK